MKKNSKKPAATSPAKAPSKPDKPCRAPSAGNPAPTPAPRLKRAHTGSGETGATTDERCSPLVLSPSLAALAAIGDELARIEDEDKRMNRWRSLLQANRPETGGEDGARRAFFARQAAEALGWPGWRTYERDGRFDPLCGNLPLLYATAAVETVTARPSMLGVILAKLRELAPASRDFDRIRAAAAEGSIPGEWHLLDYAGPVYEIPEPRPGTEYARLVAAREAQEAAAEQVLTEAAAGRLVTTDDATPPPLLPDAPEPAKRKRRNWTRDDYKMADAFLAVLVKTQPELFAVPDDEHSLDARGSGEKRLNAKRLWDAWAPSSNYRGRAAGKEVRDVKTNGVRSLDDLWSLLKGACRDFKRREARKQR